MPYLIPASGFGQAVDEVERRLRVFGDVTIADEGDAARRVRFLIDAPGWGLPPAATFEFVEWFDRTAQGWLRVRYKFEYRPTSSRRAHHQHGREGFHQHCEPPGRRFPRHYADDERLLLPTLEAFAELYASGEPIRCTGLRMLRRGRADEHAETGITT